MRQVQNAKAAIVNIFRVASLMFFNVAAVASHSCTDVQIQQKKTFEIEVKFKNGIWKLYCKAPYFFND